MTSMPQIELIEASVKMPMRKLAESLGRYYNFVDVMIESGWARARKHNGNNRMVRHNNRRHSRTKLLQRKTVAIWLVHRIVLSIPLRNLFGPRIPL
jgi:hypothetical protein